MESHIVSCVPSFNLLSAMYAGILSIFIIISSIEAELSFIKLCSISDPKLNECALKNANEVLPIIIQGDKAFKIPNITPIRVPLVTIDSQNFQVKFEDISTNVLSQAKFTKMIIDDKAKKWSFTLEGDTLELLGNYEIKGRILILTISGQGPVNVTYDKVVYTHTITYKEVERNGVNYLDLVKSENGFEFQRVHYKFDNLFGGDGRLGDETNVFLNENWEVLEKEIHPLILKTINEIANNVYKKVFAKLPKNEIFLP